MASITSIISLFVLLLATYCYSVPIGLNHDLTTSDYDMTTEKIMVERGFGMDMEFTTNETPAVTEEILHERSSDDSDSREHTTSFAGESDKYETSTNEYSSFTTSPVDSEPEKKHHLRSFDDSLFTTMESSAIFNARSIGSEEDQSNNNQQRPAQSEEDQTSNEQQRRAQSEEDQSNNDQQRRGQSENELEMTTNVESSSSVEPESFTFHPTTSFPRRSVTVDTFSKVEPESFTFHPTTSFPRRSVTVDTFSTVEPESFTFHPTTSFPRRSVTVDTFSTVEPELNTFEPRSSQFQRKDDTFETLSTVEPELNTFEPSSSFNSYVKPTSYRRVGTIVVKSTTPEYENVQMMGEPVSRVPVNKKPLVHTETIIPGQVTQTKVFTKVPVRTSVVNEATPIKQSQLNQDQNGLFLEKEKSNY